MIAWLYVAFVALVLGMLALDLGVFNRKAHVIHVREAIGWTALWITVALAFNVAVYFIYQSHLLGIGVNRGINGLEAAQEFFLGYVIEKSLSLDNIFVIAFIFEFFRVPLLYQHRVLFWGILGALILRGIMIGAGAALIAQFHWIIYVFGALLIVTAVKMLLFQHDDIDPGRNPLVRLARKIYPVSSSFDGQHFFTKIDGRAAITPLLLALLVVESTDVLFAVDSIPAIFAVTKDPFIIFTSNVFAILGLRSLYFALAALLDAFRYLKFSLVFLLAYVGAKMLLSHYYPIPNSVSLVVIAGILAVGILASLAARPRPRDAEARPRPAPGSD